MKNRFKQWIKDNIIDDDPRSLEEQMKDELSVERSCLGLFFVLFVSAVFYGLLFYNIYANINE